MKTNTPMKLRVSKTFIKYSLSLFLMFMRQVVEKMTGNASYPTPTPALTAITDGLDDLQAKADAAHGGGRMDYAVRNIAWDASIMQARDLVNYVQTSCLNDLGILLSSGFVSTKTPAPVGPLAAPENPRTSYTGTSGEVNVRFSRVPGVTAGYTVQQADAVDGPYVTVTTVPKTLAKVTGLTPAKTYFFRVCANGTEGPSGWSNPVSVIAV